jgi:hypothetical protein
LRHENIYGKEVMKINPGLALPRSQCLRHANNPHRNGISGGAIVAMDLQHLSRQTLPVPADACATQALVEPSGARAKKNCLSPHEQYLVCHEQDRALPRD